MILHVYTSGKLATIEHKNGVNTVTSKVCDIESIPMGDTYVEDLYSFDCQYGYLFGEITDKLPGFIIRRGGYIFHSAEKIVSPNISKFVLKNGIEGDNRAEMIANAIIFNSYNHLFKAKKAPISYVTELVRKPLRQYYKKGSPLVRAQEQLEEDEELFNAVKQANRGCGILSNIREQDKIHTNIYCGDIKSDYIYHMLTRTYPTGRATKCAFDYIKEGYRYLVHVKGTFCNSNNKIIIPLYLTYIIDNDVCNAADVFTDSNGKVTFLKSIDCWMTDIDYLLFKKYYNCKTLVVTECYKWCADYLPAFFTDFIYSAFERKEINKDGLAKIILNSMYGVTDSLFTSSKKDTWNYLIGTWTCSYARETQYKLIEMSSSYYSAIDSFYQDNFFDYSDYNNSIVEEIVSLGYKPINDNIVPGIVVAEEHGQMRVQGINRYVVDDELKVSGCVVNTFPIEEFTPDAIIPNGLKLVDRDYKNHVVNIEYKDYSLIKESINDLL